MATVKVFLSELKRLWPLFAIALLTVGILREYAQFAVQLYRLSMVALVIASAHIIRRAMFPYIDLSLLVASAGTGPIASALIFLGVVALMIAVVFASVVPG